MLYRWVFCLHVSPLHAFSYSRGTMCEQQPISPAQSDCSLSCADVKMMTQDADACIRDTPGQAAAHLDQMHADLADAVDGIDIESQCVLMTWALKYLTPDTENAIRARVVRVVYTMVDDDYCDNTPDLLIASCVSVLQLTEDQPEALRNDVRDCFAHCAAQSLRYHKHQTEALATVLSAAVSGIRVPHAADVCYSASLSIMQELAARCKTSAHAAARCFAPGVMGAVYSLVYAAWARKQIDATAPTIADLIVNSIFSAGRARVNTGSGHCHALAIRVLQIIAQAIPLDSVGITLEAVTVIVDTIDSACLNLIMHEVLVVIHALSCRYSEPTAGQRHELARVLARVTECSDANQALASSASLLIDLIGYVAPACVETSDNRVMPVLANMSDYKDTSTLVPRVLRVLLNTCAIDGYSLIKEIALVSGTPELERVCKRLACCVSGTEQRDALELVSPPKRVHAATSE